MFKDELIFTISKYLLYKFQKKWKHFDCKYKPFQKYLLNINDFNSSEKKTEFDNFISYSYSHDSNDSIFQSLLHNSFKEIFNNLLFIGISKKNLINLKLSNFKIPKINFSEPAPHEFFYKIYRNCSKKIYQNIHIINNQILLNYFILDTIRQTINSFIPLNNILSIQNNINKHLQTLQINPSESSPNRNSFSSPHKNSSHKNSPHKNSSSSPKTNSDSLSIISLFNTNSEISNGKIIS
jgi:hypothetical protein